MKVVVRRFVLSEVIQILAVRTMEGGVGGEEVNH
jgi:hypothetical protein